MDWLVWLSLFCIVGIAFFGVLGLPWPAWACLMAAGFGFGFCGDFGLWAFLAMGTVFGAITALAACVRRALRRIRAENPDYSWWREALFALDQGLNAWVLFGSGEETISARCWRLQGQSRFWRGLRRVVDRIFSRWEADHCLKSWQAEQWGTQLPREYQQYRRAVEAERDVLLDWIVHLECVKDSTLEHTCHPGGCEDCWLDWARKKIAKGAQK